MILTIPELKNRFATKTSPSSKDFSDFMDTVIAVSQQNIISATIAAVNAAIAAIPANAQLIIQATPPNSSNAGKAWVKIDPATGAMVRTYSYATDGNWHSRHPISPGMIVAVTDPTFDLLGVATYDGGGTPGMGAMWTIATDLVGSTLLGVGGTYVLGNTGGEASHTLTTGEMPAHTHPLAVWTSPVNSGGLQVGSANPPLSSQLSLFMPATPNTGSAGGGAAHNNLPPYKVACFLRRTTRLDYVEAPGV